MIRVLITDDHVIVRDGLRQIVSHTGDIAVVAEAGTAAEALDALRQHVVDVVVLDLNLPDRHGLDVLLQIRSLYPQMPVLILTINRGVDYAIRLLKAGAAGYLGKDSARQELVTAIRRIAAGEKYLAPAVAEDVAFHLVSEERPGHQSLTDREFQVMLLIGQGKPPREIATELNISVKTVGAHRQRILEKMGFRSTADVVQYIVGEKLA